MSKKSLSVLFGLLFLISLGFNAYFVVDKYYPNLLKKNPSIQSSPSPTTTKENEIFGQLKEITNERVVLKNPAGDATIEFKLNVKTKFFKPGPSGDLIDATVEDFSEDDFVSLIFAEKIDSASSFSAAGKEELRPQSVVLRLGGGMGAATPE